MEGEINGVRDRPLGREDIYRLGLAAQSAQNHAAALQWLHLALGAYNASEDEHDEIVERVSDFVDELQHFRPLTREDTCPFTRAFLVSQISECQELHKQQQRQQRNLKSDASESMSKCTRAVVAAYCFNEVPLVPFTTWSWCGAKRVVVTRWLTIHLPSN